MNTYIESCSKNASKDNVKNNLKQFDSTSEGKADLRFSYMDSNPLNTKKKKVMIKRRYV